MEPTASGMFCDRMLSMVNSEDVNAIIQAQRHMLDRFEKTNEMLLNFNGLSDARLQQMNARFLHHTRTLVEMKRDLDSVFRRIRTLKSKIAKQYPEAFSNVHESPALEDEDEELDPALPTAVTSEQSTGSCDSSPDAVSPAASRCSGEFSQELLDTPTSDALREAELQDTPASDALHGAELQDTPASDTLRGAELQDTPASDTLRGAELQDEGPD